MKIVTKDFLNENAFLSYPIDSRATYEPYEGEDVSRVNSLLLDLKLTLPANVANSAFVASIKISGSLVSMIIMGSKEAPYYEGNYPPTPNFNSNEYSAFSAVVLATVTVDRATALSQVPISLTGEIDGVGGWVIFGPEIQNEGSWSFSGPQSSTISSLAISRYDYGGVYTVATKGFQNKLEGDITLVGENGIEVVPVEENVLSIRFNGAPEDIRNNLQEYSGECGRRPETDTCLSKPIRSINNVKPKSSSTGKNQIVLVLDKPLYGRLMPNNNPTQFGVSSDVPLESFCGTRLVIPETECASSSQTASATTVSNLPDKDITIANIPQGTEFILEVIHMGVPSTISCTMYQQHPLRPAISVFKPVDSNQILGESVLEVHVDTLLNQWQVYGNSGPSLKLFGPLGFNLIGSREADLNGMPIRMTLGPMNKLDKMNINVLRVTEDSEDASGFAGTYVKRHYGYYQSEENPNNHIKVSANNSSWNLYENGILRTAGTFDDTITSTQIQKYLNSNKESKIRSLSVVGVRL